MTQPMFEIAMGEQWLSAPGDNHEDALANFREAAKEQGVYLPVPFTALMRPEGHAEDVREVTA